MSDPSSPKPPATRATGFGSTGHEFGKRRPQPPTLSAPPSKRSGHVALLVMGTLAIGGTAYAFVAHRACQPQEPGMAAPSVTTPGVATPGQPVADTGCAQRGWSSGHSSGGYGGNHWGFFGGSSSGTGSSTGVSESSFSSGVSRGGFGASGHAAGASSGS